MWVPASIRTFARNSAKELYACCGRGNMVRYYKKHIYALKRQLEDLQCISTQDLSLTQLQSDLEANFLKCFTSQAPLVHDGILCTMHSINPSPPTELRLGSRERPWFRKLPTLTLAIGPPWCTTTMSPPRRLVMGFAQKDGNTSGSNAKNIGISGSRSAHVESLLTSPPCSIVAEMDVDHNKKIKTNKSFPL